MISTRDAKSLPPRPYSRLARWNTDSWTWEILSCILSILTTVTVGVVIFMYDGKPVPRLPYNIGLSSAISIIGTVSKSALLLTITSCISQYKWINYIDAFNNGSLQDLHTHDEASRGPWGSFMLLVNWKGLYWVKLGALATVISLAFDPVYQALIRIEQRSGYQNDSGAIIKRALRFENSSTYIGSGSDGYFSNDWNGAITSAILSDTSMFETYPSCPTGNCTFPVFSSLGFCSNCIDITQFLQQNSNCTSTQDEDQHPRFAPLHVQLNSVYYSINCIYWLPLASFGRNYTYIGDDGITVLNSSIASSWTVANENEKGHKPYFVKEAPWFLTKALLPGAFSGQVHLSNGEIIPNSIAAIALIKIAPLTGSASTGFVNTAHICSLSVCAMEYNVSVESGVPQTEIVSTSYSKSTGHDDRVKAYSEKYSYAFAFPDDINNFSFDSDFIATSNGRFLSDSCLFEKRLMAVLRQVLQGTLVFTSDRFSDEAEFGVTLNIIQNGFNASTNIPKTMDRVATAMTNRLRDMSNITVQGQSGSMQIYIRISWWWLLLPTLTVIFETILLISVMAITRKHKLPIWKTSELALLFHGIDLSTSGHAGCGSVEMLKASEMEDVASALQVRFGRDSKDGVLKLERKLG